MKLTVIWENIKELFNPPTAQELAVLERANDQINKLIEVTREQLPEVQMLLSVGLETSEHSINPQNWPDFFALVLDSTERGQRMATAVWGEDMDGYDGLERIKSSVLFFENWYERVPENLQRYLDKRSAKMQTYALILNDLLPEPDDESNVVPTTPSPS